MVTPSPSPVTDTTEGTESKLLGMPMSIAGTVFAMVVLFKLVLIQFVSHVTGCRGLSAPEVKKTKEKEMSAKPFKRFSTTSSYESTRDLFGNDLTSVDRSSQPDNPRASDTGKTMEL